MADEERDGHGPGECPGCDATRLWHDMDPVFDKHASETGRGQGEAQEEAETSTKH
jgi:hypothetical protein